MYIIKSILNYALQNKTSSVFSFIKQDNLHSYIIICSFWINFFIEKNINFIN